MITFHPITVEQAMKKGDYSSVFKSVCIDEGGVEDVCSYLSKIPLMEARDYDGTHLGMLSVEPLEAFEVEVHAYVLPEHRNRSRELLGAFKEALFILTPIISIRTTVTGDFKPLVRFLRFVGFELVGVQEKVIHKGGQVYDLFHLQTIKGD